MDGLSPSKQDKSSSRPTLRTSDEPLTALKNPKRLQSSPEKKTAVEQDSLLEILEMIDSCQSEIENLNEAASQEIINIEQRYNKLRKPHIDKRNDFIQKIPNFWACTFINHPQLAPRLSEEDEECLHYLRRIDIENYEDLKVGYSITLHFADNPFFDNRTICKEFSFNGDGEPSSKSTPIKWKPGMNITKKVYKMKSKVDVMCVSFFSWFTDHGDAGNDEIADVLRDDLWSNPLQYYLIPDDESVHMSLMDSYIDSDEEDSENSYEDKTKQTSLNGSNKPAKANTTVENNVRPASCPTVDL